ncbi:unnamed protein product, partial [Polarella glacialis]
GRALAKGSGDARNAEGAAEIVAPETCSEIPLPGGEGTTSVSPLKHLEAMAAGLGAGESEALPAVAGRRTSGSRQSAAGSSPGHSGGSSSSSSRQPGPAPRARSSCGKYPERMCPPPLTPATAEA